MTCAEHRYLAWLATLNLIRASRISAAERGERLLVFVLASDMTAPLLDVELDLVDVAAMRTLASVPVVLSATDVYVVERLSALRHRIAHTLKMRRLAAQVAAQVHDSQVKIPAPRGGDHPGQLAPLTPPVPSLPPGGAEVRAGARATFTF